MSSVPPQESADGYGRIRYNAIDPTSTTTLRSSFQGEYGSRWGDVRGRNREWLQGLDGPYQPGIQSRYHDFVTTLISTKLLDSTSINGVQRGDHWTANYVRPAYQKGLELARKDLTAFDLPDGYVFGATDFTETFHRKRLQTEYESAYYKTEDQVSFARSQAMEALRHAQENDKSKTWLIDESNARLRSKVKNRYKAAANTVVVRAVNEGLLTSFEHAGVAELGVVVESDASQTTNHVGEMRVNASGELEFQTAGDDRVCSICAGLEGATVELSEVRGSPDFQPPIHPNCRCRLVPTSMSVGGEEIGVPDSFEGGLRSDG